MYTQCPSCRTLFRVAPDQLETAHGKVRCGTCRVVFDARAHIAAAELEVQPDENPAVGATPAIEERSMLPLDAASAAAPALTPLMPQVAAPDSDTAFPDLHQQTAPVSKRIPWAVLNAVLVLVLAGQIAFLNRNILAESAMLRPVLESLCAVFGCALPVQRDLRAIELTTRSVQTHPRYEGALVVDIAFVNRAAFAQPYPDLQLTFLNTDEKPVGTRRFRPEEYLGSAPGTPLAAGAEAHGVLEILDPGEDAFGFEFEFL